jgi:hypothetical protein
MVHHVTLGPETEPTLLRTGKWTLTRMDQHVRAQVLFLREGLATPLCRAGIRLRAKVNVHMRTVPIQPIKRLPTLIALILLRMFFPIVLDPLLGNSRLTLTPVEVIEQPGVSGWVVRVFLLFLPTRVTATRTVVRV